MRTRPGPRPSDHPCSVNGCVRRATRRGLCNMHDCRVRRKGTTDGRPTIEQRFWARVQKSGGCWEWTGPKGNQYGHCRMAVRDGKRSRGVQVHRISYELNVGPIPAGLCVCHHCDNPRCVRPDHLFLGTPLDNARDMIAKGRDTSQQRHRAKTHCPHGHEYTPENTRIGHDGGRDCRACLNAYYVAWRKKIRLAAEPESA